MHSTFFVALAAPSSAALEDESVNVYFQDARQDWSEQDAEFQVRAAAAERDDQGISIHQRQQAEYGALPFTTEAEFDALREPVPRTTLKTSSSGGTLQKRVVGWHPYWMGTTYQRYDYSKLSTIAYFSYEVNSTNGSYVSLRSWDTTPIIAWAHSNNVKVVLSVTCFGSANCQRLLTNSTSCQNLINTLATVVSNRNGDGVNIDFESVGSTMKPYLTAFMSNLTARFHRDLPGSEISICLPAVDWSSVFDVGAYDAWLDYALIMGYDYYWRGSTTAGPVAPLRASSTWGTYCVEKSIDDYLARGLRASKLILGCPYYGYDWATSSEAVPSSATASGSAVLYSSAIANAVTHGREWTSAGSVPYYTYTSTSAHQCFYDDVESLGLKYDMVLAKGIAGVGMWALGYDDNHSELWDLLGEKFVSASAADWQAQSSGTSSHLYGAGSKTNRHVVVGAGGLIKTSTDGETWQNGTSGVTELLLNANGDSGTFVAVGDLGRVLTSSDGLSWTARTSGTSEMLRGIAWGNNIYVACGNNGAIIRSTDGVTWSVQASGTNQTLQGVVYAGGQFVIAGASGAVLTSPNGTTWTPRASGTSSWLLDTAYGNSTYVAVGLAGTILTSSDAVTWTARTSGTSEHLYRTAFGNGKFVAIGILGTILSSTNGVSWAPESSGTTNFLRGLTFASGRFVACGYNGTILTSGEGAPAIAVTTLGASVPYATTSQNIAGTANANAVGSVRWVNSLGGSGSFAAATNWSFSASLSVGTNLITVTATNAAGQSASASVTIVRQAESGGSSGEASTAAAQPGGGLSDIIVYTSAGHGFYWNGSSWVTGRGLTYGMVEDIGNVDQLSYFADYCFRAGATVVPMRPVGNQANEVVLDNDSAGVTWGGAWNNSSSTIFYGDVGDVPYRYAYINATGTTAWAIYRPTIPEAGFYPVYVWTRSGSDRVKQLYRVYHSGGVTDVRVNHRRVGLGWVWLGTYYFNAGTEGSVNISNYAPGYNAGTDVVIADAVRFGNGMGSINRGTLSGFERELEASRYWVQAMVGQGMSSGLYDLSGYDDNSDNVGAPVRMAAEMNRSEDGTFWDRIYLGFHSNADGGAGTARGPMGLYDNRGTTERMDRQKDFGTQTANEINTDMTYGDNGVLFMDGYANNSANLYGSAYGELYGTMTEEMNSTIIETAFHNNSSDANLLKDPSARRVMAMSCYQAIVKHLTTNNPSVVSPVLLPDPPTAIAAVNSAVGAVTLSWSAPVTNSAGGHAATGYVIYRSTNGYGFGNPVTVSGSSASSYTLSNMTVGATYFFQVCATNRGGESLPSTVVGVRVSPLGRAYHLVVNGFERNDRNMTPNRYFANNINGNVARVIQRKINARDYVVQHGQALAAANRYFDSCDNTALLASRVSLPDYYAAYWILGRESTANETFSSAEQTLVMNFLNPGKRFFVSGTELAYDLGQGAATASDKSFLTNYCKVAYASDDGLTNRVTPKSAGLFNGIGSFYFDDGSGPTYKAAYPDVFLTAGGGAVTSTAALVYGAAEGGTSIAGIQYSNVSRIIVFGFPFETILAESVRTGIMARAVSFFGPAPDDIPIITIETPDQTLPAGTTSCTLYGTANSLVTGHIRWTNANANASSAFAASLTWTSSVTLASGLNTVVFRGSNATASCTATALLTVAATSAGNLLVTISPAEAIAAGAQWRVDGGAWRASGTVATNLSVGSHTVSFAPISGWNTPSDQSVTVSDGQTTSSGGAYTRDSGSLSVVIEPQAVLDAGAQWNVNNGAWQSSGNVVADLAVGIHTVRFSSVSGWAAPPNATPSVANGQLTMAYAAYTQTAVSVTVTLQPADAVSGGAQWRVDGGTWRASGATESSLSPGSHEISFNAVSGWISPAARALNLSADCSTSVTYTTDSSCLGADNAQQTAESDPLDRADASPSETFTKTWTLQNTGRNTWTASAGYSLRHLSGETFSASTNVALTAYDEIPPAASKTFSLEATAPASPGTYLGLWQLHRDSTPFGDPLILRIQVQAPGGDQ